MFVNLTNHPSVKWSIEQIAAAQKFGEITDIQFPLISPYETQQEIITIADKYVQRIKDMQPSAVLCQGEFTFVFALTNGLKKLGITVVAACSERYASEHIEDGVTKKVSDFRFVQFREY